MPVLPRDDTAAATAEAKALQTQHQNGIFDGPVTIPWLTTAYSIGDRIRSIQGRYLGFRTDDLAPDSEPVYPVVVGVEWTNDGEAGQTTIVHLSDAGLTRRGVQRARRRRLTGA